MPYSQFKTIAQAKAAFKLTVIEGDRFWPQTPLIGEGDGETRRKIQNPKSDWSQGSQ
jgi:hypothetical protein